MPFTHVADDGMLNSSSPEKRNSRDAPMNSSEVASVTNSGGTSR